MVHDYANKFRYYVWLRWCWHRELRTIQSYERTISPDLHAETARRIRGAINYSRRNAQAFQTKYRLYQAYLCGGISEQSLWQCIDRMYADEDRQKPWTL